MKVLYSLSTRVSILFKRKVNWPTKSLSKVNERWIAVTREHILYLSASQRLSRVLQTLCVWNRKGIYINRTIRMGKWNIDWVRWFSKHIIKRNKQTADGKMCDQWYLHIPMSSHTPWIRSLEYPLCDSTYSHW